MKNIKIFIPVIILCLTFSACRKDHGNLTFDHAFVISRGISAVSSVGITASAEILSLGNDSINSYGFVWATDSFPKLSSLRLSIRGLPQKGLYSADIDNCISDGVTYYLRPFIEGKNFTIYGDAIKFTGKGSNAPVINDFAPAIGKMKSLVTIKGSNFNSNPVVLFGNAKAKVVSAYNDEIIAEVPFITDNVYISIEQNGSTVQAGKIFEVITPWSKLSLPAELSTLSAPTSFSVNGKGYIVFGNKANGALDFSNSVWEYDPSAKSWTKKEGFPGVARQEAVSLVIGNKAYIGLGNTWYQKDMFTLVCTPLSDFWEYDPASNSWTRMADFPIGNYNNAVAFSLNGKGYVGKGIENYNGYGGTISKKFWRFDPVLNQWSQINDFPFASNTGIAFTAFGKAFVGMGSDIKLIYRYNESSDNWSYYAYYPGNGTMRMYGTSIGNSAYTGFGPHDVAEYYNDFWQLNVSTGAWQQMVSPPFPPLVITSYSDGSKGYYLMIDTDSGTWNFWEFDPEKN